MTLACAVNLNIFVSYGDIMRYDLMHIPAQFHVSKTIILHQIRLHKIDIIYFNMPAIQAYTIRLEYYSGSSETVF